jgi:hypothetical protein
MKYKPKRDIPKFARKYKTVNHSKLANLISAEASKKVSTASVYAWLKSHPDKLKKLTEYIEKQKAVEAYSNQRVLAELYINEYTDFEIVDLETLNLAKKHLGIIEDELRSRICNKTNLKVVKRKIQ